MNFQFKERLKGFCEKYNISILGDAKRRPIFHSNSFFTDPKDLGIICTEDVLQTEQVITLDISLSKLNALADVEATFFNNEHYSHHRRMFEAWMEQQMEERRLRTEYPAVEQAYEQYSILLNLVRKHPKTFKDLPD